MSAGKGDKPRPTDGEKYRSNYDRIFKHPFQPGKMVLVKETGATGIIERRNWTHSCPLAPRWFVNISGDVLSYYETELELT